MCDIDLPFWVILSLNLEGDLTLTFVLQVAAAMAKHDQYGPPATSEKVTRSHRLGRQIVRADAVIPNHSASIPSASPALP